MVRRPRGQGRKPPLGWSRGNPGGTDRSWCQGGDRVTGRKCPRQRGENGPQFPALLQAPHMPLLATQGLGDGPGLRTRCREQTRAGKGRERPRAGRPTTGTSLEPRMRQPADQAQLQSGDTGLSGRRDGHRSDKGGEGCPLGSRGSPSRSQQQQKPQSGTGRNAPGCKGQGSGPEVESHKWDRNPWPSQPTSSYQPLASDSRSGGQELCCSDLLLRAVLMAPALSLWIHHDIVHRSRVIPAASGQ